VPAQIAYDGFASVYDAFTSANNYEMWLGGVLLPELDRWGLQPGWALDIGCGTGRAFDPLLGRGWKVVGCDVSTGMLSQAEEKFGDRVQLIHSDARFLDAESICPSGGFQMALLLNGVVNYLTEAGDLERVLSGVFNCLGHNGIVVFDTNTLHLFRESFGSGRDEEMSARGWEWHGLATEVVVGGLYEARLSGKHVEPQIHHQRHWTPDQVDEALDRCGLQPLVTYGQREENWQIILDAPLDEERDSRAIHIAVKGGPRG